MRIAAAIGTLAVVAFYLIAQMVGAGNLIKLMFGMSYETAVVIVGIVMLAYVLFGGMIATTWVQIVKAVLLLGGAALLCRAGAGAVRLQSVRPVRRGRRESTAPACWRRASWSPIPWDAISLGLALMFGTAGLPHILMRFYTVPDAKAARQSVFWATGLIGLFYLMTFVLGFGAMVLVGREAIMAVDKGGNMAAPLLAEVLGGTGLLGFIAAVAFATILAVVAGLTLSGAAALSPRSVGHVVRRKGEPRTREEQLRGRARGHACCSALLAIVLGIVFKGQNVAFMVGWRSRSPPAAIFPRWCCRSSGAGSRRRAPSPRSSRARWRALVLICAVADDPDRHPAARQRPGSR